MPNTFIEPGRSEQGVDERRNDRAVGEHEQSPDRHDQHDERQHPKLLALLEECPELLQELHRLLQRFRTAAESSARAPDRAARVTPSSWWLRDPRVSGAHRARVLASTT